MPYFWCFLWEGPLDKVQAWGTVSLTKWWKNYLTHFKWSNHLVPYFTWCWIPELSFGIWYVGVQKWFHRGIQWFIQKNSSFMAQNQSHAKNSQFNLSHLEKLIIGIFIMFIYKLPQCIGAYGDQIKSFVSWRIMELQEILCRMPQSHGNTDILKIWKLYIVVKPIL